MDKFIFVCTIILFVILVCRPGASATTTGTTTKKSDTTTSLPPALSTPRASKIAETQASATDVRLEAPWVAAIFHKTAIDPSSPGYPQEWKFLCSGTITSPFTVMTSARCVLPQIYGPRLSLRPHHIRYADLKVVAGLPTTELSSKDKYTQFGSVGQIRDAYDWNTNGDTPDRDLAVLRLTKQLNLTTPYVKDVDLFEFSATVTEAKETRAGETLLIAGYDSPDPNIPDVGVQTRAQEQLKRKGWPLKLNQVTITDVTTCIDRHTEAYPTYYFNVLCATTPTKSSVIPCHYKGAGLVKKIKDDAGFVKNYLFGVYSSNSALAHSEGTLVEKNMRTPPPCSTTDIMFISRYSYLGEWATSSQFCGHDLAMCNSNNCRPWTDLCNGGLPDCADGSDEKEKPCFNQHPQCDASQFRCAYGACIASKLMCDGVRDCIDGSDEDTNWACKGRSGINSTITCDAINAQENVTAFCESQDRKSSYSCDQRVPAGTQAVLRREEIIVKCGRDGKWSRRTSLSC